MHRACGGFPAPLSALIWAGLQGRRGGSAGRSSRGGHGGHGGAGRKPLSPESPSLGSLSIIFFGYSVPERALIRHHHQRCVCLGFYP